MRFDDNDPFDKFFENPTRSVAKVGCLALLGYLVFWLVIIAAVVAGLWFLGVGH